MRSERSIINDWVVERVDGCTCGGGGFDNYPHENGCGWEPLFRLSEAETALAEYARLREVIAELVRLKDGPRDAAYLRAKPLAWQAARDALAGPVLPVQADDEAMHHAN